MSSSSKQPASAQKRSVEDISIRPAGLPSSPSSPQRKRQKKPDYLTTSSQAAGPSSQLLKKRVLSTSTRLFVKRVKIDREAAERLRQLASSLGAVTTDAEHANIIVTDTWSEIRAKAGLRPELYEKQAHVVHSSWLEDTSERGIYLSVDQYRVLPAPISTDVFAGPASFEPGDSSTEAGTTDEEGDQTGGFVRDGDSGGPSRPSSPADMKLPLRGLWVHVLPAKLDKAGVQSSRARVAALGASIVPQDKADLIVSFAAAPIRIKPFIKGDEVKVPLVHSRWLDALEAKKDWVDMKDCTIAGFGEPRQMSHSEALRIAARSRHLLDEAAAAPGPSNKGKAPAKLSPEPEKLPASDSPKERDVSPFRFPSREGTPEATPEPSDQETVEEEVNDADDDDLEQYEWVNSEFACQRPSPLRCINQGLVEELGILQKQRNLVGESRSSLSYERALSSIKAYRKDLREDPGSAKNIKGVGTKINSLVKQYYEEGEMAEVRQIRSDSALKVMMEFMELYGIGPTNARWLYNEGCRTVEDVITMKRSYGTKLDIRECLKIVPDLRQKIPRPEVESIAATVMSKANELMPGCVRTICGGYRRGKPASGDVDIVIAHADHAPGTVSKKLVERLKEDKLVTHVIGLSFDSNSRNEDDGISPTAHSIAELVFRAKPTKEQPKPLHRRIDLIFCRREVYGACVVGWTGSTMFERDIRRWARKQVEYKFHNYGITDLQTGELIETPEERDVFEALRLKWIPPRLRNCDV